MNNLSIEKTMTVKEVAEALSVSEKHIRFTIDKLYPDKLINGMKTYLNESEITAIKLKIQQNPYLDQVVELPKTNLEKQLIIKQAMKLQEEMIIELQKENEIMRPKVESFEALQRSDKNISITECAKHFGLHPKIQVFPWLRTNGYLTSKDLPTQKAIDAKILIERHTQGNDGVYRGQSVVEVASLETWRIKIIPKIIGKISLPA